MIAHCTCAMIDFNPVLQQRRLVGGMGLAQQVPSVSWHVHHACLILVANAADSLAVTFALGRETEEGRYSSCTPQQAEPC